MQGTNKIKGTKISTLIRLRRKEAEMQTVFHEHSLYDICKITRLTTQVTVH